uniref:Secreted protein n=1 Tax=Cacopsylla melanoneura TaxID=428564 RepID=A0A8D8SBE7_9HEMI
MMSRLLTLPAVKPLVRGLFLSPMTSCATSCQNVDVVPRCCLFPHGYVLFPRVTRCTSFSSKGSTIFTPAHSNSHAHCVMSQIIKYTALSSRMHKTLSLLFLALDG